jgi:phosphoribosylformylglycinamidine cyclo-ligase
MTYAGVGVDYASSLDAFKRAAQQAGLRTARNILRIYRGDYREFEPSRGESAYLLEHETHFLAHVEEGLGTKNLVADAMYQLSGKTYYDLIAQDTVAAIVNDLITVGARPVSIAMHLAAGDSSWFKDERRTADLITGWERACNLAGCVWGAGETPVLKGVVAPETVVLSGSAVGHVEPKKRLIRPENIQAGDAIVTFDSSGIHANGLTLAREIAENLPEGYLTTLPDGRTYGETLLDPTHIYAPAIERLLDAGVEIHYAVNITGHGWRKLMRAPQPFRYVIDDLPWRPAIFDFIQERGPVDEREMFGTFNMGMGFAIFVSPRQLNRVLSTLKMADVIGHIEASYAKEVVINSLGITFSADTLQVR